MATYINGLPPTGAPLTPPDRTDADRQEIVRLAQQFESMLLTQMLREMRRSMLDDEEQDSTGLGMSAMTDTGDIEFGQALGRNGGLGLSSQLLDAFQRQVDASAPAKAGAHAPSGAHVLPNDASAEADMSAAGSAKVGAHVLSASGISEILPGSVNQPMPISSAFGWRRDPITGTGKFHNGVDIAVAYGQEVTAAGAGTVAFAGTQNGYGQTVVIDHGNGRQTRYAHLSEQFVRAGDRIADGQVLGKSGNSGRSTGPHLHFELLVDGRPVNPASGEVL